MKKISMEFLRRGLMSCSLGPLVLAALYLILNSQGIMQMLTVREVCTGIISLSVLAFVAGGMNVLYQIEKIPLMVAILIHGSILYLSYLATYLINGWMEWGTAPILVFTVIFTIGYLVIWAIIYVVTRKNTDKLNKLLDQKKKLTEE